MSTSPASTGPAGAHFEGQVGAHYLLSMLIDSDPRGLPGVAIDRIEFQRRAEGHPLDDIVVHAHDNQGCATLLEIQVKRSVTFAPSDRVFREVVGQVAEASRRPAFRTANHRLAVAIFRGSQRVTGPYQDVLTWARRLDSTQTFMGRLNQSGAANEPMRTFVDTFRNNLRTVQAPHDDTTVHHLLSRFQILQFDYGAPGSLSEAWDNERSSQALDDGDRPRARDFHRRLVELAIETEAAGGDLTRDRLIERLREGSFRLAGRRGYRDARRSLAEASRHALDDIEDRVGGVTLIRAERISAVRAALDQGRYVEIRGDAGVGKSALLKHFAEQLQTAAPIVVLSPRRTPAGGWTQMKVVLGLNGTARDLLVDMAGSGSTSIFLDGLDFFSQQERTTIRDLVREAAKIPGIALIVTARSYFGSEDEPNWLPGDALAALGHAEVHVDELNKTEVDEIVSAAPQLGPLLTESHPARNVARNLFRLSRLAAYPDNERPRTEIDLAERWWQTADGESDGRRDRSRLLLHLAKQAIAGIEPTDSSGYPSCAVDALVESQTLRDLGGECMMFHHDIYRDWAIANVLYSRPDTRGQLELDRAVPAALVRGIELTARMSLERRHDGSDWQALLKEVSRDGAHRSWRRAVLLAPVRSEIAIDLLHRISDRLFTNEARLLRELIQTVMAVDSVSARKLVPAVDPKIVPDDLYFPVVQSWFPLISWLLSVDSQLPSVMIPKVAALYFGWCLFDQYLITSTLVSWFYRHLTEIEYARYPAHIRQLREPFGGALKNYEVSLLETNIRTYFLSFCHHNRPLAVKYLQSLETLQKFSSLIDSVLGKPGSLARAAPKELANFTIAALLSKPKREEFLPSSRRRAFEHRSLFVRPSPDLGPFLDLLSHAPTVGLKLVGQVVDHAVFYGDRADTSETLTISFVDGSRTFAWLDSYGWARSSHLEPVVTTALMALGKWGHRRIEKGDPIDAVLADVLAPSSNAAAYLLVAVDLLCKHWPMSHEIAIPFAACPELLCLDHLLSTSLDTVQDSGARQSSLLDLLGLYATTPPLVQRDRLASSLHAARDRLGPYGECSDLDDPAFMVRHALNLIDPDNWNVVDQPTGRLRYSSPDVEQQHLKRRQYSEFDLQSRIKLSVGNRKLSSPEFAAAATTWARGESSTMEDHWIVVAAAALAMRDGDDDLRRRNESWAVEVFEDASKANEVDGVSLWSNPVAISLVGWAHLLTHHDTRRGRQAVLGLCARSDGAAAPGFRAVADVLAAIDERLPTAILRTAFAACIRRSNVEESREIASPISDVAIDSELSWMDGNGGEPTWPADEADSLPSLKRLQERVDMYSATRWLMSMSDLLDVYTRPWLRKMADTYARWTAAANWDDPDDTMRFNQGIYEWNEAYFKLLAHCMPGLEPADMDQFALNLITSLLDRPFFDVAEQFILNVDKLYFGRLGVNERQAVHIRSVLVRRLTQSRGWRRWDAGSMRVETSLYRAIAALFLASQPQRCLLGSDDADLCDPLLPTLQPVAERVDCYHVTLSLLEVSPRPAYLEFIVEAAEAWMKTHPEDNMFWIDYDAGKRLCSLIEVIRQQRPPLLHHGPLRDRVDHLVDALVSAGVTEAAQLEKALSRDPAQER